MINDNDAIQELADFIFDNVKQVQDRILSCNFNGLSLTKSLVDKTNVYVSTWRCPEETHLVFQLGEQSVQTDIDSFIAKNVISVLLDERIKIFTTKTPGKSVMVEQNEDLKKAILETVQLFKL